MRPLQRVSAIALLLVLHVNGLAMAQPSAEQPPAQQVPPASVPAPETPPIEAVRAVMPPTPLPARVELSPQVHAFVSVEPGSIALTHVRVIDGTGAPAREDQTILIGADGRIAAIGPAASTPPPRGARVIDLAGHSVLPGWVGMHEHLFYTAAVDPATGPAFLQMSHSFPLLYLAAGATTIRTAGSVAGQTDINMSAYIAAGQRAGPEVHATAPYLGRAGGLPEISEERGPERMRAAVDYWAGAGATSFKAYMQATREELTAIVTAAHARNLPVTGHLCATSFAEAAAIGIDNLEHGFVVATDFIPNRQPDVCPQNPFSGLSHVTTPEAPAAQALFATLREHRVAITSTLAVLEQFTAASPPPRPEALIAMAAHSRDNCLAQRRQTAAAPGDPFRPLYQREMAFELAFARSGGTLLVGSDPTGNGCVIAGDGLQRGVELLVAAGFTPLEAIRIATLNGATFLGIAERTGTVVAGKEADLIVVRGDPSTRIEDVRNVRFVFSNGAGYDPTRLTAAARGWVGIR
ncbi:amidohydrolase family protein [Sphingosinicella sp.]|uniref:amidohydrolase family protein n=1 Tax=Sphingosinicella sp. TaxID=1917971 RepID=UPI004037BB35